MTATNGTASDDDRRTTAASFSGPRLSPTSAKVLLPLAAFGLLVAGIVWRVPQWLDRSGREEKRRAAEKTYRRTLAEGIRIGRRGLYGIDLIRCGKCTLRKLQRGPLTFGALNELVLEDLHVVLPPPTNAAASAASAPDAGLSARELAERMGMGDSFLTAHGVRRKFSGLSVERLSLGRLDGTNAVTVVTAAHGEAKRDGLHLADCTIYGPDTTNRVPKAVIRLRERVRLEWRDGVLEFGAVF